MPKEESQFVQHMTTEEMLKRIRVLERKLTRSEANRVLIEEALESHIRALKVSNAELIRSHHIIKLSEEKFKKLALYDPLTNLPTRTLLMERFGRAIFHADRGRHSIAVLFIDIDNFKHINDSHGHDVGDVVLREVGSRLAANIRDMDTASRLSGDEFVILLESIAGQPDVAAIAETILVAATNTPITIQSTHIPVSVSIGISLYPLDSDRPDELLKKADIAMYAVKKHSGNAWCFYKDLHVCVT